MYTPQYTTASKEMEGPYHPPMPTAHHNVNSGERICLYFPTEFKNTHIGFYPRYVTDHWGMKDGWRNLLIHNPPQMVDVCRPYILGHPCFATTVDLLAEETELVHDTNLLVCNPHFGLICLTPYQVSNIFQTRTQLAQYIQGTWSKSFPTILF